MVLIPLVFWLVLTLNSNNSNAGMSVILPVPFGSQQDCDTAGTSWLRKYNASYVCVRQRASDVAKFNRQSFYDTAPVQQ